MLINRATGSCFRPTCRRSKGFSLREFPVRDLIAASSKSAVRELAVLCILDAADDILVRSPDIVRTSWNSRPWAHFIIASACLELDGLLEAEFSKKDNLPTEVSRTLSWIDVGRAFDDNETHTRGHFSAPKPVVQLDYHIVLLTKS